MDRKGRRQMGRGTLLSPPPLLDSSGPAQVTLLTPINSSASQAKGRKGLSLPGEKCLAAPTNPLPAQNLPVNIEQFRLCLSHCTHNHPAHPSAGQAAAPNLGS